MTSPPITGEQLTNVTDSTEHLSEGRPIGANLLAETYVCGQKRVRGFHLHSDHANLGAERIGERFLNALFSAARGIRFRGWERQTSDDNHAELSAEEGQAVIAAAVGGEDLAALLPREGPRMVHYDNEPPTTISGPPSAMTLPTSTKAGSKEAEALGMCAAVECNSVFNDCPLVEGLMCNAFNSCAVTLWDDEQPFRPVLWMIARDYFDGAVDNNAENVSKIDRFVAIATLSAILAEKGVPRLKQQQRCYASSLQHEYGDLIDLPPALLLSEDTFVGGWWGWRDGELTVGWEVGGVFMKFTGPVRKRSGFSLRTGSGLSLRQMLSQMRSLWRAHTAGPIVDAVRREKPPVGGWFGRAGIVSVGRSDWAPRFFDRNKAVAGIVKLLSSVTKIEGPGAPMLFDALATLQEQTAAPVVGNLHDALSIGGRYEIPDGETLTMMRGVFRQHFSGGRLMPQWSVPRRIAWLQLHWSKIAELPVVPKALPMLLAVCAQSGAVCSEMLRVSLLSGDLIENPLRHVQDIPWLAKQQQEPTLVELFGLRGWLFAFLENDYNSDPEDDVGVGEVTGYGFAPKLARDGVVSRAVFGTAGSPILLGLRWAQYGLGWHVGYWESKTGVNVSPGKSVSGRPVLARVWGMSWEKLPLQFGGPVHRSLRHRDGVGGLAVADNTEVNYRFNGWMV